MHPPNHGIKHQLIMSPNLIAENNNNNMLTGYPTFDTVNIVEFNAYGQKRVNHNSRATIYHPLTIIYSAGERREDRLVAAIVYKRDRFKLIY